jgi:FixJ family two-component response regulator
MRLGEMTGPELVKIKWDQSLASRQINKNLLDCVVIDPYSGYIMEKTLLIVDDELEILETLVDSLDTLGAKIYTARNGQEALEIVKSKKIMVILSDVNMPTMKGTDFLKQVRALGLLTPFVILTAYGDKKMALEALRLGAFDFIDKPWSHEKLFSVLEKSFEIGSEILFWENEVDIQASIYEFQSENSKRIIATLSRDIPEILGKKPI